MNKKRKILTVAGLIAFAVITAHIWGENPKAVDFKRYIHIEILTLGVLYAGLFALLGGESKAA
jgi:hypothetical protein